MLWLRRGKKPVAQASYLRSPSPEKCRRAASLGLGRVLWYQERARCSPLCGSLRGDKHRSADGRSANVPTRLRLLLSLRVALFVAQCWRGDRGCLVQCSMRAGGVPGGRITGRAPHADLLADDLAGRISLFRRS